MMKKVLLFVFIVCCSVGAFAQGYSSIKGKVTDKWLKRVYLYKTVDGNPVQCASTDVAEDGSYGFLVPVEEPAFYAIGEDNRMHFPVWLKGGDEVNIDLKEFQATLNGENTKENVALYKWRDYSHKVWLDAIFFDKTFVDYTKFFPEFEKFLNGLSKARKEFKSGNKEFDRLLQMWVDYDTDYYAIIFLQTPRSKHPNKSQYPAYYSTIVNGEKFDSDDILRFPDGVRMLVNYGQYAYYTGGNVDQTKISYEDYCLEQFKTDMLKGVYLTDRVFPSYRTYEDYMAGMEKYQQYFKTPNLMQKAEAVGTKLYKTRAGGIAADFTYPDMEGKMVSLSDFRGKVVLIDVWATWCGPCRGEIPALKKLEKEMEGTDVVFMSVSVDEEKNHQKWLDTIEKEQLGGVQLFANGWGKITKDYKISGIPRFIVIDRQGKVASVDAPRPSNPALKALLEKELGK